MSRIGGGRLVGSLEWIVRRIGVWTAGSAVAPPLEGDRKQGDGDDEEDGRDELGLLDRESLAEDVAEQRDDADPERGADGRPSEEAGPSGPRLRRR